tara:strand:- start:1254 stop:1412 length:159 start_codon:yes stop_codon:yes gene_type:complete
MSIFRQRVRDAMLKQMGPAAPSSEAEIENLVTKMMEFYNQSAVSVEKRGTIQ